MNITCNGKCKFYVIHLKVYLFIFFHNNSAYSNIIIFKIMKKRTNDTYICKTKSFGKVSEKKIVFLKSAVDY